MASKLVLASAGAGKSQTLIDGAIVLANAGKKVLLVTYTENNQRELMSRLSIAAGTSINNIRVKGWFTFLLEDMIRPYQRFLFPDRISGVFLNQSDPHKRNGRNIPGRSEQRPDGSYNPTFYLTASGTTAHTHYLAKLAVRVCEVSGGMAKVGRKEYKTGLPTARLEEIYDAVFIDEVQDLVGWDYEVLELLNASGGLHLVCVGDFRQTIYETSSAQKHPTTSKEKLQKFHNLKFEVEPLNVSKRCIQSICSFADRIHGDEFPPTTSHVTDAPADHADHTGVYAVRSKDAEKYISKFLPTILRDSIRSAPNLCELSEAYNFGKSKGLGFDRTFIILTGEQKKFLSGDRAAFTGGKTEKARNRFYVAVTRARYSVALLTDDEVNLDGITVWR